MNIDNLLRFMNLYKFSNYNMVGYIDPMPEYYLHIDPSKLSDDEWAEKFKQLDDIRCREAI